MLLSEFYPNRYANEDHYMHNVYQKIIAEAWLDDYDPDNDECFSQFDIETEVAVPIRGIGRILKVDAKMFMSYFEDLKRNVGAEAVPHCILKFFFEEGNDSDVFLRQEVVPVAYSYSNNALIFKTLKNRRK